VSGPATPVRRSAVADMDPTILYRVLELRVAVFVVEQRAAYSELDGRDAEAGAELLWVQDADAVLATARVLRDPHAMRIGRVATAAAARGRGHAAALMRAGVDRCREVAPTLPIVLDAQEHLAHWYARFGFAVSGDRFHEDGIPHVPMTRQAG
jgi:ElaA protein